MTYRTFRLEREGYMHTPRILLSQGLLAFLLVVPHGALAPRASAESQTPQAESLQRDIEALKAGQQAILHELQEIKKLLSARGAARGDERSPLRDINTIMNVADAFTIGDKKATLTLVEFTDYQCPFCARYPSLPI